MKGGISYGKGGLSFYESSATAIILTRFVIWPYQSLWNGFQITKDNVKPDLELCFNHNSNSITLCTVHPNSDKVIATKLYIWRHRAAMACIIFLRYDDQYSKTKYPPHLNCDRTMMIQWAPVHWWDWSICFIRIRCKSVDVNWVAKSYTSFYSENAETDLNWVFRYYHPMWGYYPISVTKVVV